MSAPIITVDRLPKLYRIGAKELGYKTFCEAIIDGFKTPTCNFQRLRNLTKFDTNQSNQSNQLNQFNQSNQPNQPNIAFFANV